MKHQGSKHDTRDPYMVIGKEEDKIIARKIPHSTQKSNAGPALSSEICKIDLFLSTKPQTRENLPRPNSGIHYSSEKGTEDHEGEVDLPSDLLS